MAKCKIISEICCNHAGDINIAKEMIKMSKLCGADYVKFQKRNPVKAIPAIIQNLPHPCPIHSFGTTYLTHRQALEFSTDEHRALKQYSEEIGIGYSCSVWDIDSAKDIISLNPDFIKVPSAMNENYELLEYLFSNYAHDIHISLGMISIKNKEILLSYLKDKNNVVIYQATSSYPVKFNELFLAEINNFKKDFRVGFSGHHLGIAADIAALTLGVEYIERHFTLDRTSRGTDHSASLEPNGLQKLCRDIRAVEQSLTYKNIDYTEDEEKNIKKLKIKKDIVK